MKKQYHATHRKSILAIVCMVIITAFGFRPKIVINPVPIPKVDSEDERIVFTSTRDGNYEIYSMRPDGSEVFRLTDNPKDDYHPSISPNGQKIAFASFRDEHYEIYTMNLDGTDPTRITNSTGGNDFPEWSPDGTQIIFTSWRDGNSEIYVMNADGTSQANLTNNPADDVLPTWSPDGRMIAFASSRQGSSGSNEPFPMIYIMNSDGTNPQLLLNGFLRWHAWSPDGTKIAFASGGLLIFDLVSQTETMLMPTNTGVDGKVAWSPNGTEILFSTHIDNAHAKLCRVNTFSYETICMTSGEAFDGDADWGFLAGSTSTALPTDTATSTLFPIDTPTLTPFLTVEATLTSFPDDPPASILIPTNEAPTQTQSPTSTPEEAPTPSMQQLRIMNSGSQDILGLVVKFPGSTALTEAQRVEFGNIPTGGTSEYQPVPSGVFRYAAYEYILDDHLIHQAVMDWVGESPMTGLNFTYRIILDTQLPEGGQIQLIEVVLDVP